MKRMTLDHLNAIVARINRMTNSPLEAWTKDATGKHHANISNYHLDGAYGGYALHRMVNVGGGVKDIFGGHYSKQELSKRMFAFIAGLEAAM